MNLYIVRHGQSQNNVANTWSDDPTRPSHLTVLGREQAHAVGEQLKNVHFDAVFTSQLHRTQETAQLILKGKGKIHVDARLNEQRTGLHGKSLAEYFKHYTNDDAKLDGAESWNEMRRRLISFVDDLKKQHYNNVLIVTHMDPMRAIIGYIKKLPEQEIEGLQYGNCQVVEVKL